MKMVFCFFFFCYKRDSLITKGSFILLASFYVIIFFGNNVKLYHGHDKCNFISVFMKHEDSQRLLHRFDENVLKRLVAKAVNAKLSALVY